eukprot:scaffold29617_cov22-Cyclotella_meneghiniana.AAC.1
MDEGDSQGRSKPNTFLPWHNLWVAATAADTFLAASPRGGGGRMGKERLAVAEERGQKPNPKVFPPTTYIIHNSGNVATIEAVGL